MKMTLCVVALCALQVLAPWSAMWLIAAFCAAMFVANQEGLTWRYVFVVSLTVGTAIIGGLVHGLEGDRFFGTTLAVAGLMFVVALLGIEDPLN